MVFEERGLEGWCCGCRGHDKGRKAGESGGGEALHYEGRGNKGQVKSSVSRFNSLFVSRLLSHTLLTLHSLSPGHRTPSLIASSDDCSAEHAFDLHEEGLSRSLGRSVNNVHRRMTVFARLFDTLHPPQPQQRQNVHFGGTNNRFSSRLSLYQYTNT